MTPQELLLKASQAINLAMHLQAEKLNSDSRYAMSEAKEYIEAVRQHLYGNLEDLESWYIKYVEDKK
jgi:hypothetical protein